MPFPSCFLALNPRVLLSYPSDGALGVYDGNVYLRGTLGTLWERIKREPMNQQDSEVTVQAYEVCSTPFFMFDLGLLIIWVDDEGEHQAYVDAEAQAGYLG